MPYLHYLLLLLYCLHLSPHLSALPLARQEFPPESSAPPVAPSTAPSPARLILRAPPPPLFTSWYTSVATWYSSDAYTSPSVTLHHHTRICPADYPLGFSVVCEPGQLDVSAPAIFSVDGVRVKRVRRSWYGPYEVEGHFRGGVVVWEGFATGDTVTCQLGSKIKVSATIKVDC